MSELTAKLNRDCKLLIDGKFLQSFLVKNKIYGRKQAKKYAASLPFYNSAKLSEGCTNKSYLFSTNFISTAAGHRENVHREMQSKIQLSVFLCVLISVFSAVNSILIYAHSSNYLTNQIVFVRCCNFHIHKLSANGQETFGRVVD